ncbi:hypothetical protein P168DRAFT_157222 [Aspergillus campestris IBT 28561]|uniref:Uncharacterized protein n=1 Tax=Aspergillus campestris (strain IBT 28561) TaxID=1392248 RepID=A0A2I1D3B5_ASPC2|nr:uncharacterized protein P168DRAFT_157222 [Aspergillus campestris IBT 28561]PKY04363.1 hypothetical protein P168DRAFT_157222 [Aspergillus campestris IBT 28561]
MRIGTMTIGFLSRGATPVRRRKCLGKAGWRAIQIDGSPINQGTSWRALNSERPHRPRIGPTDPEKKVQKS